MTKRKDPADLKIRSGTDTTPVARTKRGANATPEGKAKRIAKLRASASQSISVSNAVAAAANPHRPLTEKQKLFVHFWAKGESVFSASCRAGYADSGTAAYKMIRDPAILLIYNREKALYEESCQMTRKRVMEGLLEGIDMAKHVSEPASVITGWREIGKMCGYYEPVKRELNISIKGDVTVKRLERMTDADLIRLVKGEVTDVAFDDVVKEVAEATEATEAAEAAEDDDEA